MGLDVEVHNTTITCNPAQRMKTLDLEGQTLDPSISLLGNKEGILNLVQGLGSSILVDL